VLNSAAARRCAEGALDTLYVSVDGATKETYESIRRGASFERLLRNLDLLIRTVKAKGAGKPRVIFVTVLMKRNMEELPGILALAKMFSVGAVYTQQLCHNFAEPSLIKSCGTVIDFVDKESLFGSGGVLTSKVFAAARRKAERLGIELHLPKERYRLRTTARAGHSWCDWPWKGFYVSWQGEIMPCCMVSLPGRYSLGSAERTTLRNMENNRRLAGLRRRLSAGRPPLFCAACPLYYGMF
jgi:MoaA/NifB/PqqE/SkfB family radical SAM enzyme